MLKIWKAIPHAYLRDALHVPIIWSAQDEILRACPRAIAERKHIYVGSGHSLGKDYIAAAIALWFLDTHAPSKVILTAPTDRQVKNVMYAEVSGHWSRRLADLGGQAFTSPRIEHTKDSWFLIGFTTKETGVSAESGGSKFQGYHSPNVCVIVSEAQAVEDKIFDQIEAITTNENILVIFLGNPTRATGRFAKGLRDKVNNIVFNFSCLDNPNYKERREVIPGLASYGWVEDKRKKWGEDDPRWQGRVLGQIPSSSIDNVFSEEIIQTGLKCKSTFEAKTNAGVSMDVAGEGVDDNVIMGGRGGLVNVMKARALGSPSLNAIECQEVCANINGTFIIVDCDGLGIGTWQELNKITGLSDRFHLVKYHGCAKLAKPTKSSEVAYENLRSKAHFIAKERLEQGKAQVPNDEELLEEMREIKFFENKRGLIQIEDKEDIKERLGRSPDKLDAWVMLQYGFHLDLQPKRQPAKKDAYSQQIGADVDIDADYPFNPATV